MNAPKSERTGDRISILIANLQSAETAFGRGKEGYHWLGKPVLQLRAVETRHRALAATKDTITLPGADQAELMHPS